MGIYIGTAKENTYIEYGKDSGIHNSQLLGENITLTGVTLQGQPRLTATFLFEAAQLADTIFSGALKVLPVLYKKGQKHEITNK